MNRTIVTKMVYPLRKIEKEVVVAIQLQRRQMLPSELSVRGWEAIRQREQTTPLACRLSD